jgi:membrane protein
VLKQIWQLVREGMDGFVRDQALTRGAAIAFYIVTAIAPILYITVTIAGVVMGQAEARDAVTHVLGRVMSHDSAVFVGVAIRNARGSSTGIVGGVIGIAMLIVTASGVFGEMEDALNVIWQAPRKGAVIPRLLRGRAVSLVLVIGLGFLLVISMLTTSALAALSHYITVDTPYSQLSLALLNGGISFVLAAILFAAIYKILPNLDLEWRDVIAGAVGTAALFQVGQLILAYFLGTAGLARSYGAAGGLILLLFWVYYSAQIFLLGAEFTKVYACRYGSHHGCETPTKPEPALPPRLAA